MRDLRGCWDTARVYGRGVRLVFGNRRVFAVTTLLVLLASVLAVLQPWLLKQVVDRLATPAPGAATAVLVLAGGYALTLVVPAVLAPVQQTLSVSLDDQAVGAVDRQLIEAGRRLTDLTRIESPAFHDDEQHARAAAMSASHFAVFARNAAGQCLTLFGLLGLVAGLHPLLAVGLAATIVPHLVTQRRMHRSQFETMAAQSRPAREMDYCVRLTTQADGAKEVRTFGLGGWFLARYERLFEAAYAEVRTARLRHLRASGVFAFLHGAALVAGFWFVLREVGAGGLGPGDVALYVNAMIQLEAGLFGLSMSLGLLYETGLYFRQLFGFVDRAVPGIAVAPVGTAEPARGRPERAVELRDVHFGYSTGPVLRGVNAVLPAGSVTAIVGDNGAGKSTVVKLLTRMYDPTSGEIRLDGRSLAAYDLVEFRARLGAVFQDFARFALTARENIAVGDVNGPDLSARVEEAARRSGADEVVASLPAGYDTPLTRLFEGGVELSGGQWQKLATARGLLRDAGLVVLDEPTAALDADAERRLFDTFRTLLAGRTGVLISHRFSTVRMADQILVVHDGRVVEAGGHRELVALGGRYATMFEMQAGRYR